MATVPQAAQPMPAIPLANPAGLVVVWIAPEPRILCLRRKATAAPFAPSNIATVPIIAIEKADELAPTEAMSEATT